MKNKTAALALCVPILVLLFAGTAPASESIRCGNQLVQIGDTRPIVRKLCGEPADIAHSIISKSSGLAIHNRTGKYAFGQVRLTEQVEIQVEAETWLFNFGPNRFMTQLRFVDGQLERIDLLGYGY